MSHEIDPKIEDFIDFIYQSPSPWHAVDVISKRLRAEGFLELLENNRWNVHFGGKYFVTRNGSSICAFIVPQSSFAKSLIIASHTDSPGFKLKPNAEFRKENMIMLGLEVYGSPLITSWLNRDLGIAGRIIHKDEKGTVSEELIILDEYPITIPQIAVHLDRQVNESGLLLNKQEHLAAIAALDVKNNVGKTSYLEERIKEKASYKELLGSDLFVFPLEKPTLIGYQRQMIAAYRIDNLGSAHAALIALLNGKEKNEKSDSLRLAVWWDNEEIGSETAQGAGSPFLSHVMERISLALGMDREDYLRSLSQSFCVSIDQTHGMHPNFAERHEPRHPVLLGRGVALKFNAQQRYATDARSSALIVDLCQKHNLSLQKFVTRGDTPCGTTIGPIHASNTGMATVDIGYPQLSMHSARELAACQDHLDMCTLLTTILNNVA